MATIANAIQSNAVSFAESELGAELIVAKFAELFDASVTTTDDYEAFQATWVTAYLDRASCNRESAMRAFNRIRVKAKREKPKATSKGAKDKAESREKSNTPEAKRATAESKLSEAAKHAADAAKEAAAGNVLLSQSLAGKAAAATLAADKARAEAEKMVAAAKAESWKKDNADALNDAIKAIRADTELAALVLWTLKHRDQVSELMEHGSIAELSASLASAGKRQPAKLKAKPVAKTA